MQLSAIEALQKAYDAAMMETLEAWQADPDAPREPPGTKSLRILDEMTHAPSIPLPESPWVCFNTETGELGRAYSYKGEFRIRPVQSLNPYKSENEREDNAKS